MAAFQKFDWQQQHQRINLIIGENDTGKTDASVKNCFFYRKRI
jgi:hypothetical protein